MVDTQDVVKFHSEILAGKIKKKLENRDATVSLLASAMSNHVLTHRASLPNYDDLRIEVEVQAIINVLGYYADSDGERITLSCSKP